MASHDVFSLCGLMIANNALTEHLTDNYVCGHDHENDLRSLGKPKDCNIRLPELKGCGCEGILHYWCEDSCTTTVLDTPWHDPGDRNSEDFLGLYMLDWQGFEDSPYERHVYDNLLNGAVFGRERMRARRWTVRGVLVAATCCGGAYGLRWLKSVLRGCVDCDGCSESDFDFLDCCPDCVECDCDLTEYQRTLRNVALESGPRITNRFGGNCGCGGCALMEIEFDLVAGNPWIFRQMREVCEIPLDNSEIDCVTWRKPDDTCKTCGEWNDEDDPIEWVTSTDECSACGKYDECPEPTGCDQGPCLVDVPVRPPDVDPNCDDCEPVEFSVNCCTIGPEFVDEWQDTVPVIELYSGEEEAMRHVTITITPNPRGLPAHELDPCDACATFEIPFLGARSSIYIDGASQDVKVSCPGHGCDSSSALYQPGFSWPVLECGIPYTVCVRSGGLVPEDSTLKVSTIVREM